MRKSTDDLCKKLSFTLTGIPKRKIEDIDTFLREVTRGSGIHTARKGKGSYNRKRIKKDF